MSFRSGSTASTFGLSPNLQIGFSRILDEGRCKEGLPIGQNVDS